MVLALHQSLSQIFDDPEMPSDGVSQDHSIFFTLRYKVNKGI